MFYHADCGDGFCCAWIARRNLPDDVLIAPLAHGEPVPALLSRRLLFLDISLPEDKFAALLEDNNVITVLDHHKSHADTLSRLRLAHRSSFYYRYHDDKSAARLTWEFFHPTRKAPWLVDYTEDRDLWRWQLPESREVTAALYSYPFDHDDWDKLAKQMPGSLVAAGSAILRNQERQLERICKNAHEIKMAGHDVLAVNTPLLVSEAAGRLAVGRPFGCAWYTSAQGKVLWSLRSSPEGVDVSQIAMAHGGGGHPHAAGFIQG